MPSSSIIIPFRNLLSVLLLLPLVFSCRQDDPILPVPPVSGKGETAEVTLSVRIPDFRAANTRGVDEKGITEITVLMFADEGGAEKVKVKYDIPSSSLYTPSGSSDTKIFNVPVTAGTYKRITLIANAQTELAGITAGSTYDALKQVEATGKFGQEGTGTYIPMYGEHAPTGGFELKAGVSQTIAQEIPLIRMLAKVDIINPTTSGVTTVAGKVYFVNPIGNGRVWVDLATYNTTASQSGYMTPTLPATLQPAVSGGHPLEGTANTASPNVITYYLNEQPATSGGSRPCIVINLAYRGREYYYRMDYTWDGIKGGGASPYEKGKYMPILRNHRYIFTIKEVKGPGFQTLEEAVTAPNNFTNHNIVVVPIVINEAFTDITFNESGHFLAVTRTAMTLQGRHDATSTQNKFSVRTNYPSGWKVGAYNADGTTISVSNSWLKPSQNSGAAGATLTNPVTEELQAITNGKGFKDGYLEIRAGRLYTKINIKQIGTPLDYVAEYNLAGGSTYNSPFTSSDPPGISPTAAQTDPNLRWASSHSNDQSGYYNWYVLTGENDGTYNPNAKRLFDDVFFKPGHPGHGYHLPSRWELTSVFSYNGTKYGFPTNDSNVNEAIEFGGIKKTFANDYFSSGNGVCYALRFKQGTGNPIDGSSLSDFPLATDNNMVCAYRYTRVGSFANHDFTSLLKVDCVYLGSAFTGNISTINNDSWWDSHTSRAVVRIFPAAGYIVPSPTSISSGFLEARGEYGRYWSGTEFPSLPGNVWNVTFYSDVAFANDRDAKFFGLSIRLFADK